MPLRAKLSSWFGDSFQLICLGQVEYFGQNVEIAVKLDPALQSKDLVLYTYNEYNSSYKQLTGVTYTLDKDGYLHFIPNVGGAIIISDGHHTKKS